MRLQRFFLVAAIALSLIYINGCTEHNTNPDESQNMNSNQNPPSLPQLNFLTPLSTSNDPALSLISGYIGSLNALNVYSDAVASGVKATKDNNDWVWTYIKGALQITLRAELQSDGNYHWNAYLSGTKDSVTYNNWLSADGISSLDGKNGTWRVFRNNSTIVEGEYTWDKASDGTISGTAKAMKNGSESGRIELTNHPDKSGELQVFVLNDLFFKALWQSDGSGQWWRYGLNGAVLHEGTWK
ncbi:MAG: hypothetical protein Q8858_11250 [Bacteroidota bacterium]|nr:hypothetical protein [Bacteroidota bacterium]